MEMESVLAVGNGLVGNSITGNKEEMTDTHVADTPGNSTLLTRSGSLVGLALNAEVHDVVSANGTVVDDDVPSP